MIVSSTKYHLALIVSLGILAALMCQIAGLPARFSAHLIALPIVLLFVLFWPLCMLAIRRATDRSTLAGLGPLLYAGLIVTLMVSLFGKPVSLAVAPMITVPQLAGPAFWSGMLLCWFVIEGLALADIGQAANQPAAATT
jgi:hypothetical protein